VVRINNPVARKNKSVALHAGLVGVTQSPNWELKPIAGWHVTEATPKIGPVLDRIVRDHETTPPVKVLHWAASAEVVELYERFGSATAADGQWRIVPADGHRKVFPRRRMVLDGYVELADGRILAMIGDRRDYAWVLCRFDPDTDNDRPDRWRLAGSADDVPVLGTSLAMVLDVILDGDDPARLEIGRLDELDVRDSWGE
jgi:hypothetical protein